MKDEFNRIKKTASDKLGWVIAIISLILTIYLGFFKTEKPKFEYDIVSSTRFINNEETAYYLKILIDTLDVQENHLNISAYNVKIENKGTKNIRYDDYDKGFFGLNIVNGTLLEPPTLIETSSEHIKKLFRPDSFEEVDKIQVPAMSLDIDDYYILHIVLLHKADIEPELIPEGKIIGQKLIILNQKEEESIGFWVKTFGGNWLVQLVRALLYFIVFVLLILLIIFISDKVDDCIRTKKRKKVIKEVASNKELVQFVVNDYLDHGAHFIERVNDLYNKTESEITTKYKKSKAFINSKRALESNNREAIAIHNHRYSLISSKIDKGYFELRDDDSIVFNKEAQKSVQVLYSELVARHMISYSNSHLYNI